MKFALRGGLGEISSTASLGAGNQYMCSIEITVSNLSENYRSDSNLPYYTVGTKMSEQIAFFQKPSDASLIRVKERYRKPIMRGLFFFD